MVSLDYDGVRLLLLDVPGKAEVKAFTTWRALLQSRHSSLISSSVNMLGLASAVLPLQSQAGPSDPATASLIILYSSCCIVAGAFVCAAAAFITGAAAHDDTDHAFGSPPIGRLVGWESALAHNFRSYSAFVFSKGIAG